MLDHVAHHHDVEAGWQIGLEHIRLDHLEAQLLACISRAELAWLDPSHLPAQGPRLVEQEAKPATEIEQPALPRGISLDPLERAARSLTLSALLLHVVG